MRSAPTARAALYLYACAAVLALGSGVASGQTATAADKPAAASAKGTEPIALPPPWIYMSSAWSFWPHAWGYVPTLWSAWYKDWTPPPSAAEKAGQQGSTEAAPDSAEPHAPKVTGAPPLPAPLTGEDIPHLPPPRLVYKRRLNLVISGVGLLVATWAADRLLARDLSTSPGTWVPLVGPWYLLAEQSSLASPSRQTQVFLVADGLLQATGLTMSILGFVLTTKRYVVTVKPTTNVPPPKAR